MERLKELFLSINELKVKYDKQRNKDRFNVFTALHKEYDEVNLHSRFISYLLSQESGHGMEGAFSQIFIREILKLKEKDFSLLKTTVIPNEAIKSEFKEIDILIINKQTRQAIIIENKIHARDNNRIGEYKKDDGYDGQLERYYNTIKKGKDKNGNLIPVFKCDIVFIYYLTMFKKIQPSPDSIGKLETVKVIYYENEIKDWLEKCIQIIPKEKSFLSRIIQQYLNLINKMTHNDIPIEERTELKNKVAENWESAKYLIDNFKHVKWHTVNDLWTTLKFELGKKYQAIEFYPNEFDKTIGEVTHHNKDTNHGIIFNIEEGKKAYISNSGKLSWGIIEPKKWADFKDEILENISFSDFSTENTYRLIDKENMANAIEKILIEISEEQDSNFKNLNAE